MYEDPNVSEVSYTVVFTIATDEENEPQMRGDLVAAIKALADDLGCEVEIDAEQGDSRQVVTEAWLEAAMDRAVQSRLRTSAAYRNAASAEEQSEAEERITADVERDYAVKYRVEV
jgi:hypothetical protein